MASPRRALVLATALAVALACPGLALAGERETPRLGPLPAGAPLGHVHDTVIRSAPARAAATRRRARSYRTADGHAVQVEASASYPADPAADQRLVDFLGSRLHGPELGRLRVYVGTPAEITRLCGGDPRVAACYAIDESRMYVPGESVRGIPVEYPITHEYGHHIALSRMNSPWPALDWGAKHWASTTRVCAHVGQGELFPGNQGVHYFDDPGEGFADGYAHLHYPAFPWRYNELMRPDRAASAAIRRDVLQPWSGPRTRTFRGRLGPRGGERRFHVRVTLDGDLALRMLAPPGARYDVTVETRGFASGRALANGGGFRFRWCRRRPVERVAISVRPRSGAGRFAVQVSWPG